MFDIVFYFNGHNLYSISKLAATLINTPFQQQSYFLAYHNNIFEFIKSRKNQIIFVFSFTTSDFFEMCELNKKIKEFKNVISIAGGPHTSALPIETLNEGFDFVFVGEGEKIFLNFLYDLQNNKINKNIYENQDLINLDDFIPFAYNQNLITPVEIMRGCIKSCFYCQTSQLFKKVRFLSPSSIIKYLKYVLNTKRKLITFLAPIGNYYFYNDLNYLIELFENVKTNSELEICFGHFPSELHPEFITEDLLRIIKKYCSNKKISIGFQSGSERILKKINRNISIAKMVESVELANKFSLIPIIDFLFGLPEEKKEDRELTKKLIEQLLKKYNVLIHPHIFLPLPGTKFWTAQPSIIEDEFLDFLSKLPNLSRIKQNWAKHLQMQKRIIEYRDKILK
ncbi:MAG TPA: TIGR04013 family B12-binding domain/radical SAM domain-containing protein [bacterium]|nr:TIGR04013 family B12-binding domain/radical SAM domain-containing protein [bacterium]HOL47705.1 TIGR04013 family B12-binding domain/radical SAM domain-containing protein [bacterium]HPQ19073.1 TIGR04013 family B12-binding domain/radical SAM domain-containing protein [bacterium]